MRLPSLLVRPLNDALRQAFGEARVLVFGSRTDEAARGGDLDLAVVVEMEAEEFRRRRFAFKAFLARREFPLEVDIVHYHAGMDELLRREIDAVGVEFPGVAAGGSSGPT